MTIGGYIYIPIYYNQTLPPGPDNVQRVYWQFEVTMLPSPAELEITMVPSPAELRPRGFMLQPAAAACAAILCSWAALTACCCEPACTPAKHPACC